MARKKPESKEADGNSVIGAINAAVTDLYKEHEKEIREVLNESENKTLTVNFKVDLDESDSEPVVKTSIRFSSCVTDSRVARLDDPNQLRLLTPEQARELPGMAKKGSAGAGKGKSHEDDPSGN